MPGSASLLRSGHWNHLERRCITLPITKPQDLQFTPPPLPLGPTRLLIPHPCCVQMEQQNGTIPQNGATLKLEDDSSNPHRMGVAPSMSSSEFPPPPGGPRLYYPSLVYILMYCACTTIPQSSSALRNHHFEG